MDNPNKSNDLFYQHFLRTSTTATKLQKPKKLSLSVRLSQRYSRLSQRYSAIKAWLAVRLTPEAIFYRHLFRRQSMLDNFDMQKSLRTIELQAREHRFIDELVRVECWDAATAELDSMLGEAMMFCHDIHNHYGKFHRRQQFLRGMFWGVWTVLMVLYFISFLRLL